MSIGGECWGSERLSVDLRDSRPVRDFLTHAIIEALENCP
jgi:hypothetical protein